LDEVRSGKAVGDRSWSFDPVKVSRYFVLECVT
jgi:hypothetical protein